MKPPIRKKFVPRLVGKQPPPKTFLFFLLVNNKNIIPGVKPFIFGSTSETKSTEIVETYIANNIAHFRIKFKLDKNVPVSFTLHITHDTEGEVIEMISGVDNPAQEKNKDEK